MLFHAYGFGVEPLRCATLSRLAARYITASPQGPPLTEPAELLFGFLNLFHFNFAQETPS